MKPPKNKCPTFSVETLQGASCDIHKAFLRPASDGNLVTQKHSARVPLGERRRSRKPKLSGSAPDGSRVRTVSPRDLFPAAHTRKPNAKSVPAQLPPPGRPPNPRRACARPHARSGVRRRPGVASRWETRARGAARGVRASFPPSPHSPPRSLPSSPRMFRYEVSGCDRK